MQTAKNKKTERRRKSSIRPKSRRYPRRTLAFARKLSPLAELIHLFQQEKIQFQVVGMSAAILQGVPATTLDTDLWINLPERQYFRILNLCHTLGARALAKTVVALKDDTLVNFIYRVDGLGDFSHEYRKSLSLRWLNTRVHVLPLRRIIQSKKAIQRPKDLAHLPILLEVLKLKRKLAV